MNIKVTSDSTGDLPVELREKYGIDIVPLIVMKDNVEYYDGQTIMPMEIFQHVNNGGALCSTAARSVMVYQEMFAKYAQDYDAVFHVSLGASFSSSYQNACIAAEEFDNVYVIDSANLTVGQGFVALKILELAQTMQDPMAIKQEAESYTTKVETSFVLDRLDYMVKGGRCSSTAALGANLLHLKPCIELKDGKMGVGKKYRGSYEKCIESYARDRLSNRVDIDRSKAFLVYTDVSEQTKEVARKCIRQFGQFEEVIEATAGCTISCHCGPGTLGIIYVRK